MTNFMILSSTFFDEMIVNFDKHFDYEYNYMNVYLLIIH